MRRRTTTTLTAVAALALPLGGTLMATPAQAAGATATCDGRPATIVVPPGIHHRTEPVTGTPGDDVIVGTDKHDTIDGLGGDDTICGLEGADRLVGGSGDDRLFGGLDAAPFHPEDDGYAGDTVVPGPGDDHVDLGADPDAADLVPGFWNHVDAVSFEGADGPVSVDLRAGTASGQGIDTIVVPQHAAAIVGSRHDDDLAGTDGVDYLYGAAGDDRIRARGGDDLVQLDRAPDDRLEIVPGDDRVWAGKGRDVVVSESGRDRISGGRGHDRLTASAAGTVLRGNRGRDNLTGERGVALYGGKGRDRMETSLRPRSVHTVHGGRGADTAWLRARRSDFRGSRWLVTLPGQRVTADGRRVLGLRDTERVEMSVRGKRVTFLGDRADNFFLAPTGARVRAHGRGGRDHIIGSNRGDLIHGGPGRDRLDGRRGRDRCIAGERLTSCERRR